MLKTMPARPCLSPRAVWRITCHSIGNASNSSSKGTHLAMMKSASKYGSRSLLCRLSSTVQSRRHHHVLSECCRPSKRHGRWTTHPDRQQSAHSRNSWRLHMQKTSLGQTQPTPSSNMRAPTNSPCIYYARPNSSARCPNRTVHLFSAR